MTDDASFSISIDQQLARCTRQSDFIHGVTSPGVYLSDSQLVHSTATDRPIFGVTCLSDEVFVVLDGKPEVDVCDVNSLTKQRRLTVTGLSNSWDMTSYAQNKCLFIINYDGERVYRVELNECVTSWTVNGSGSGLSMTAKCNVLVTLYSPSKLKEFTQNGQLIREIILQQDVAYPHHAVQFASGQFVGSHVNGDQHRVCLVGDDERVIQFYEGKKRSAAGQMNVPYHLAVDKQGFILTADHYNNRVLLLSPSLTCVKELITKDRELHEPFRLCLDEKRRYLYVGEWSGSQVSAFKF